MVEGGTRTTPPKHWLTGRGVSFVAPAAEGQADKERELQTHSFPHQDGKVGLAFPKSRQLAGAPAGTRAAGALQGRSCPSSVGLGYWEWGRGLSQALPSDLRLQRSAGFHACQVTLSSPQVFDHDLAEPIAHVHLRRESGRPSRPGSVSPQRAPHSTEVPC